MIPINQNVIQTYKQLHQIPEIGLKQYKTTKYISQFLAKIEGLQILTPSKQITGIVCKIAPKIQSKVETYLFRCDIDALPFKEQSGLSYASQNGMHHACGHDAHTTIMLYAIQQISKKRQQLTRNIIFCFQPGQQGHGGAQKVLQAYPNLLDGVQHCFAIHIGGLFQKGTLGIPKTYATANSAKFHVTIKGKSCHLMMPQAGIDANRIGCQIINYVYGIKSQLSPKQLVTMAIYNIQGGSSAVAISNNFSFSGSLRCFDIKTYHQIKQKIEKYSRSVCEAEGAEVIIDFPKMNYRAVKNDEKAKKIVAKTAQSILQNIEYIQPSFAGEDFCEFSEKVPSCYVILGTGLPNSQIQSTGENLFPLHSNRFKLDQTSLEYGIKFWVALAFS